MTNVDFSFNQNFNQNLTPTPQPSKKQSVQEFFQEHRPLAITILVFGASVLLVILAILIVNFFSGDPTPEPEDPPYIVFQNEELLDHPILEDEILFNLNLILISTDEINSAPASNPNGQEYVVTIEEVSSNFTNNQEESIYRLSLSDQRRYMIYLLINLDLNNTFAIVALDRTDGTSTQDYIIAFTNPSIAYYQALENNTTPVVNETDITDHITHIPLTPLPSSALAWIDTLHLTNPQTIYSTMPSIR